MSQRIGLPPLPPATVLSRSSIFLALMHPVFQQCTHHHGTRKAGVGGGREKESLLHRVAFSWTPRLHFNEGRDCLIFHHPLSPGRDPGDCLPFSWPLTLAAGLIGGKWKILKSLLAGRLKPTWFLEYLSVCPHTQIASSLQTPVISNCGRKIY